jgi:hypothetical protein
MFRRHLASRSFVVLATPPILAVSPAVTVSMLRVHRSLLSVMAPATM